jgi:hypothetical protein
VCVVEIDAAFSDNCHAHESGHPGIEIKTANLDSREGGNDVGERLISKPYQTKEPPGPEQHSPSRGFFQQ